MEIAPRAPERVCVSESLCVRVRVEERQRRCARARVLVRVHAGCMRTHMCASMLECVCALNPSLSRASAKIVLFKNKKGV